MMRSLIFIVLLYSSAKLSAQKEGHQWIFNFSSIDSCDNFSVLEDQCGTSILDFNFLPPKGYRNRKITLDFKEANTSICDSMGELLFYSNGMAIDGPEHKPVINGDTINYRSGWNTLIWQNEHDEWKSSGHRFVQSVGFIPLPDHPDTTLAIYQNYTRTGQYRLF